MIKAICVNIQMIFHLNSQENFCIINQTTQNCKITSSVCYQKWTELNLQIYLYFYCDSNTVRIICDEHVFSQNISKAGIIHLQPGCSIKGDDFTLISYQQLTNTIDLQPRIYTPTVNEINHLINISIPIETISGLNVSNINKTFNDLSLQIKSIQQNSQLIDLGVSYHDLHQYIVCYVLVAAVGIAAVLLAWRCVGAKGGKARLLLRIFHTETIVCVV
ncbi:unnamed protein product, partial [Brenthis ino]